MPSVPKNSLNREYGHYLIILPLLFSLMDPFILIRLSILGKITATRVVSGICVGNKETTENERNLN